MRKEVISNILNGNFLCFSFPYVSCTRVCVIGLEPRDGCWIYGNTRGGVSEEHLEGLDGGLGTSCYLLNCVKLALLFVVVCRMSAKRNIEVGDELLMQGIGYAANTSNGHKSPEYCVRREDRIEFTSGMSYDMYNASNNCSSRVTARSKASHR